MPETDSPSVSRASVILAFDVGKKKTGIAVGNRISGGARPLGIVYGDTARQLNAIAAYMEEWQPGAIVVGLPTYTDGKAHGMTARARRFAEALKARFALPVQFADERHTTQLARQCASGSKGGAAGGCASVGGMDGGMDGGTRANVDAAAAAIILQNWLDGAADMRTI